MLPLPRKGRTDAWAGRARRSISRPSKTLRCSIGDGSAPRRARRGHPPMCTAFEIKGRNRARESIGMCTCRTDPQHSYGARCGAALLKKPAHAPQVDIRGQRVRGPGRLEQRGPRTRPRVSRPASGVGDVGAGELPTSLLPATQPGKSSAAS